MRRKAWWIVAATLGVVLCLVLGCVAGTRDEFAFLNRFNPRRVDYKGYFALVFPLSQGRAVLASMRAELGPRGYVEGIYPTEDVFTRRGDVGWAAYVTGPHDLVVPDPAISAGECAVHGVRPKNWLERQLGWLKITLHLS